MIGSFILSTLATLQDMSKYWKTRPPLDPPGFTSLIGHIFGLHSIPLFQIFYSSSVAMVFALLSLYCRLFSVYSPSHQSCTYYCMLLS